METFMILFSNIKNYIRKTFFNKQELKEFKLVETKNQIELKDEIEYHLILIIENLVELIYSCKDGFDRFNYDDYFSKSSKIKTIQFELLELMKLVYFIKITKSQYLNVDLFISQILNDINNILITDNDYQKELIIDIRKFILELILNQEVTYKNIISTNVFFIIRNFIGAKFIESQIEKNPNISKSEKLKFKNLNYLNYSVEEYSQYLYNNLHFLIRDYLKFINKYSLEKEFISDKIDAKIMVSLRASIYNDITLDRQQKKKLLQNKITLRGWFKDTTLNEKYFNWLEYKKYERSKN